MEKKDRWTLVEPWKYVEQLQIETEKKNENWKQLRPLIDWKKMSNKR